MTSITELPAWLAQPTTAAIDSMAIAILADNAGVMFREAEKTFLELSPPSRAMYRREARAVFEHLQYIRNDDRLAFLDAEMGIA